MQVIVYTNSDGGVSVCYPTGELSVEEVQAKATPAGSVIVENDALPNEHNEFFNAWELSGSTVSVNMDKAKTITKTRLRMEREPLLAAQDVAFQRALESSADTSAIVVEKQRLRDITLLADSADSLDALKALKAV
jgi:hypothetical protein